MVTRWIRVVCLFVAAAAFQVLMYAPLWPGHRAALALLEPFGEMGAVVGAGALFIGGPACAAALGSVRILRGSDGPHQRVPARILAVVVLLAILSGYAGVFISINTWGT